MKSDYDRHAGGVTDRCFGYMTKTCSVTILCNLLHEMCIVFVCYMQLSAACVDNAEF